MICHATAIVASHYIHTISLLSVQYGKAKMAYSTKHKIYLCVRKTALISWCVGASKAAARFYTMVTRNLHMASELQSWVYKT